MRREAFDAIGGFDAGYRHIGEDVDLCLRARAAGFHLTRCPEAVVEHAAETDRRPVLRRSFEQAYALHALHRRHGLQAGRYWRNPGPLVRGDWALRRFGIDPRSCRPASAEPSCASPAPSTRRVSRDPLGGAYAFPFFVTTRNAPRMNGWIRQKYVYVPGARFFGVL